MQLFHKNYSDNRSYKKTHLHFKLLNILDRIFLTCGTFKLYTEYMITLNSIASLFLAFSDDKIIMPILIIGYIWVDRKIFFEAICLILISILLNFSLKITFKIPFPIHQEGFAFPSGHTQSSVVLYGWLLTNLKHHPLKILLLMLIAGIGWSLVYFDHHNYFDVIGGVFFGCLLLLLYKSLTNPLKQASINLILLSVSTLLILYIKYIYNIKEGIWKAYFTLIGIISSESLLANKIPTLTPRIKITATILCLMAFFTIQKVFSISWLLDFSTIDGLVFAVFLPFSLYLSSILITFIDDFFGNSR
jgi:membrane-associated phospholipid phosphatase